MESRNAYQAKLTAQLHLWNARLATWKAQADIAQADMHIAMQHQIDALHSRQQDMYQKLEALKEATDESWEELKTGIGKAWDACKEAFDNAAAKFKD